jgi:acyl-[acyl-carrier-protein]-phospholipid O-acyltransferase/long-chain-fatty-acid--[acyl-carrier-protein] ligase
VEEALIKAYNLLDAERPIIAVAGRPDKAKGEALVLLAAMDLELDDVREKLSAAGFANLWIPKEIKRVELIPALATGKLDLFQIQVLASES